MLKQHLIYFAILLIITSCNTKQKEAVETEPAIEDSIKNSIEQPNWSYDPYDELINELDSLGLHYETITFDEYNERYSEQSWVYLDRSNIIVFNITSDTIFDVGDFHFKVKYDAKMNYNDNAGSHYGGISEMKIFKNKKEIQRLKSVEDIRALGTVEIAFYDINLDGHIDMRFILSEGKGNFYEYHLFNPEKTQFEHREEWDYLRPNRYNYSKKQFITIPYGTAIVGDYGLYQINGNTITKIKTFHYHPIIEKNDSFITIVSHN